MRARSLGEVSKERGEVVALLVTDADVDDVGADDRRWWDGWLGHLDGAECAVEEWQAQLDFIECGCAGADWRCGHFGWRAAIVRPAAS